jgi:hypothetical protein
MRKTLSASRCARSVAVGGAAAVVACAVAAAGAAAVYVDAPGLGCERLYGPTAHDTFDRLVT